MDLTPAMLRFRECARHVWNVFFQPIAEGWHEFINVEAALFEGMVLVQVPLRAGGTTRWRAKDNLVLGYWEPIAVVPVHSPIGLPAMRVRAGSGNNTNQWEEFRLEEPPLDLRFIEFFDFANYNDPRDFKYVRARAVGPAGHALVGEELLLETEYVKFEARAGTSEANT